MAKELPYFKFEPSEWDNGNIQMCSRESKGLFADLCSLYWSRLGELPYALALQKLCNGKRDALQELINHDIIGIVGDNIAIEFLDEQLSERGQISEKRRESAQKRWKDANALQMQSKSNAKRREENIKEEKKIEESRTLAWFEKQIDEIYLETLKLNNKDKDISQAMKESYAHLAAEPHRLAIIDQAGCKRLLNTWLSNTKVNGHKEKVKHELK
jgi:hypothetical protein